MTTDPRYPGWKNIKTHDQYMRVVDAERAVIEAAKALEASLDHPEKDYQGVLKVALAVRALQEVE